MFYNLIVLKNIATIRPASDGLSDLEFQLGARIRCQCNSKLSLFSMAYDTEDLELLEDNEFKEQLVDPEEQEHQGLKRRSIDSCPETYNRGPYARKYKA